MSEQKRDDNNHQTKTKRVTWYSFEIQICGKLLSGDETINGLYELTREFNNLIINISDWTTRTFNSYLSWKKKKLS